MNRVNVAGDETPPGQDTKGGEGVMSLKDTPWMTSARKLRRGDQILLAVLVIITCAAGFFPLLNILRGYLSLTVGNWYLLAAHAGAVPVWQCSQKRRPGLFLVATGIFVVPVAFFVNGARTDDIVRIIAGAAGFAATFCLVIESIGENTNDRRTFARQGLLAVFGLYVAVLISRLLLIRVSDSLPVTFDRYLYAIDEHFGGQLSFAAGRLFSRVPSLRHFCFVIYVGLPFAVLLLFANLKGTTRFRWLLLAHFAFIGIVGRLCYSAVPAMGPIYQFPTEFPWNAPAVASLTIEPVQLPPGNRNAMPSLHTAWVLMLFWWTYRQRTWLQVAAGSFLFLTLLATLGLGEHYLVDLIVAVPFAGATMAFMTCFLPGHRRPWVALGVELGLLIVWFFLFRSPLQLMKGQTVLALSASTLVLSLLVTPWRNLVPPAARDC